MAQPRGQRATQSSCGTPTISWWVFSTSGTRSAFLEAAKERFGRLRPGTAPRQDPGSLSSGGLPRREPSASGGRANRRPSIFWGSRTTAPRPDEGTSCWGRKPVAKQVSRTLKRIKEALRRRRHDPVEGTARWLGRVVDGWLNYYAVPTSGAVSTPLFPLPSGGLWWRAMRRRSQKDRFRFGRCR